MVGHSGAPPFSIVFGVVFDCFGAVFDRLGENGDETKDLNLA